MATKSGKSKFKDWNLVRLGESATFLRKLSLSRDQMSPGGEVSYLHYGDIHVGPRYRLNAKTEAMPTIKSTDQGNATLLSVGDLVFVDASEDTAGIGKSVEITDVPEGGLVAGLHTIAVRFDKSILADGFKAYLQEIPAFRSHLLRLAAGTKVLASTKSQIATAELLLPSIEEQEVIASVLSSTDSLIDSLDSLIAKKRDIKQGAMQQLLTGKTRLPGFSGEWQPTSLSNLGTCIRGVTYNPERDLRETDTTETSRLLRSNNVFGGRINTDSIQFVSTSRVAPPQVLRDGDIVICMANGSRALVGKSAIFYAPSSIHQHTFGAFMGAFRCDDIQDSLYVSYLFQSKNYRNFLEVALSGSSINNLNPGQILEMVFTIPNVKERRAIAELLSDMDAEIDALVARREKTALIKTGMMQELLTGRTRLL